MRGGAHVDIEVLHIFAINNIRIDQKLLEKLLNNEDEEIKLAALKYCIFVKPSKSILVNIKNIFEDTFNTKIKALSLEILLEKSKNIDEDYLNFALSSEDVRKLISYRLPFLKNKNIPISTMKIFLEDKNDVVKIAALTYLGNSKNKKYCSFLKSYMYKPLKNNVKSAYIWAISKLNCRYAPKYILYIISDMNSENEIRLIASKYLNNLKPSLLEKYKKNIIYIYKKELLERANVHGNYYGTLKSFVYENLLKGKSVLLDIDPHGAFQIKQKIRDSVLIFILPPSWDELKKRLQKRKSERESEIQKRLRRAREEIKFCKDYDYLIVNDRLEKAYEVLKSIYIAEKRKTRRFLNNLENEIKDPYLISLIRSEE
ncbi:MAG TPA: hypothetical protein EYP03_02835 [Aquificae bacterium]|nr:hypothetical protein [Aquificota bacterium]